MTPLIGDFARGRLRGLGRATLDARKVTSTLINLGFAGNNNSREGPPCMCPLGAWVVGLSLRLRRFSCYR